MFCPNCGQSLTEEAQFCTSCGSKIEDISEEENDDVIAQDVPLTVDMFNSSSRSAQVVTPELSPEVSLPPSQVVPSEQQAAFQEQNPADSFIPQMNTEPAPKRSVAKIAVPVALALAALGIGIAIASGGFGNTSNSTPTTSSSESQAATSAASSEATEISSVTVKNSVEDYSWDELSSISEEIAAAADEEAALGIAGKYNLIGLNGRLDGSQTKLVSVAGIQVPVRIIGFAHDDKTGGGKAGITFQFADCIAEYEMNTKHTNSGGWEASAMREWLNSDVVSRLPEDLAAVIVPVDKKTNNVGEINDPSSVTVTSDVLWLPSTRELGEDADWYEDQGHNDIANSEGVEYKLFRDVKVSNASDNGILVKSYNGSPCYWWERSPRPNYSDRFMRVTPEGYPCDIARAGNTHGVAPGFCI